MLQPFGIHHPLIRIKFMHDSKSQKRTFIKTYYVCVVCDMTFYVSYKTLCSGTEHSFSTTWAVTQFHPPWSTSTNGNELYTLWSWVTQMKAIKVLKVSCLLTLEIWNLLSIQSSCHALWMTSFTMRVPFGNGFRLYMLEQRKPSHTVLPLSVSQ